MRTTIAVVLCVVLAGVALAAPGDNLLADPGFEKGAWPQSPAWHGAGESVAENALSGAKAGKLTAGPEGDATILMGYIKPRSACATASPCRRGLGDHLPALDQAWRPRRAYLIEARNHMALSDRWQEIAIDVTPMVTGQADRDRRTADGAGASPSR